MPKCKERKRVECLKELIKEDSDGTLSAEDIQDLDDCDYVEDVICWLDSIGMGDEAECCSYIMELLLTEFVDKG